VRYINKGTEPISLSHQRAFLRSVKEHLDCDLYDHHLDSETERIHDDIFYACVHEQQGLCAYTGQRVLNEKGDVFGHVEHLIPRSASCPKNPPAGFVLRPYQTIEWGNLVACFPATGALPSPFPYGAVKKDNWPPDIEAHNFVSPLDTSCEPRFRYDKAGGVRPNDSTDTPTRITIGKLDLDYPWLHEARRAVIEVDMRCKEPQKRGKLLKSLEDRSVSLAQNFAFQRSQVLKREWAGTV